MAEYVRLWLDHPAVGCGYRALVVVSIGRKLAQLVEPTTGALLSVPKETLRLAQPIERPRWRRLVRQIQTARRRAKLYGWRIADKQLAAIAAALRTQS